MEIKKILSNEIAFRIQLKHFVFFWLLPNVCALVLLPIFGLPTFFESVLFLFCWLLTVLAVSVGFHRLFTHKSFQTFRWLETAFAIFGMMAGGGSLISWVSIHRRHHEFSDREGDLHSPLGAPPRKRDTILSKLAGYLYSHVGWMRRHEYPNPLFYCRDLYKKPYLVWANQRYQYWVLLGLLIPAAANGFYEGSFYGFIRGFYFGGLFRLVIVHHIISAVNSICHGFGFKRYETDDRSTNCWWLALPTAGESWHNNHHEQQTSAYFGHVWWELDLGGYLIWCMEKLRLAWGVHGHQSPKPVMESKTRVS